MNNRALLVVQILKPIRYSDSSSKTASESIGIEKILRSLLVRYLNTVVSESIRKIRSENLSVGEGEFDYRLIKKDLN